MSSLARPRAAFVSAPVRVADHSLARALAHERRCPIADVVHAALSEYAERLPSDARERVERSMLELSA